jgi:RNA polymerase sigma factor (sigma-70 family)
MSSDAISSEARTVADLVARRSYGKLVALLAARTGDPVAAEDALSEAFLAALVHWPQTGCPDNPEGWLLSVARRKSIDADRRQRTRELAADELLSRAEQAAATPAEAIPDQRLALMFTCAHPAIDPCIRAPLMLQLVLGLNAERIASAFLVSPATMGQRLTRAKQKIKEAGIPFRIPGQDELTDRLDAVLVAIYAAFAEGWTDPVGTDAARRDLADEALFLGGLIVELMPEEPEALGLLTLMLHAEARRRARRNQDGEYVPLAEQDTDLWDTRLIDAAEALLLRASRLNRPGRYQLEGAIQSAHVERRRTGRTNWPAIIQLYDGLLMLSSSPVVAINRALARAEVAGAEAALAELTALADDKRLRDYQPYWAARADLLARTGAASEAHHAYEIAIGLERDPAVRRFLQGRQGDTIRP